MDDDDDCIVKCICSDKKVVVVDLETWECFNKMVPEEGFDTLIAEPVEMYLVRSAVFKKVLAYCVRVSDATFSYSDVLLKRWMYDEFLHSESLISLFHLLQTADCLSLKSLDTLVIQYVEDKSEEEISFMVRNEELKNLLKIVKLARYYLKNPENLFSVVLPLVKKSQEEFSQMIVNKDLYSLIKLIKVATYIRNENVRKAAHNHILCKSSDELSHEIHNQTLKSLIKIFMVARNEKLQPLQDMVVQYVNSKSKKELVQMVSTELSCRRSNYLDESEYLRRGTTKADEMFGAIYTFTDDEDDDMLNQIPIEEEATNQIPIEDGSKKKEECKTKTNKLKLVPCVRKKPRTSKLNLTKDLSDI